MKTWLKMSILLAVIAVAGIVFLIVLRGDEDTWIKDGAGNWVKHGNPTIQDFGSCAKKYSIRETYPEQCQIPDGPTFTKKY